MCSEPRSQAAPAARCLWCSVGCPVRVIRAGPDRYLPDYVPHAGYAGLCGRGSVLVELLDHAERVLGARRRAPGNAWPLGLEAAAKEMGAALREADTPAVVVDGNFDVDTLAAAGRFAAEAGARWSVYVPPADAGLVRGLDASGCRFLAPEDLAQAGAILVVGNAYATHPVLAHWIFEARTRQPRMDVLVIADACGVTGDFATELYQPLLAAGEAARAVAAIRTGSAEALGPQGRRLGAWKDRLRRAERPAIVVGAGLGQADAARLAAEVAKLAQEIGAGVCPLTTYGNAWGALRTAQAGGAAPLEDLLAARPRALLIIGTDLESALGTHAAGAALESAEKLLYVGAMPNRTSARAALVLPAAFPFESAGRALLGPGREVRFEALLAPPAGVPTVREVLAMAGGPAEAAADLAKPVAAGAASDPGQAAGGEGLLLAPACDPIHFADGSLTRLASWPQTVRPRPVLVLAESDAQAAGLVEAGRAVVTGPGGSVQVDVATSAAQRPGQALASAAFAEVRDAFGWRPGGAAVGTPVRVTLRKA